MCPRDGVLGEGDGREAGGQLPCPSEKGVLPRAGGDWMLDG